jgi:UDP:flavonoid glycosyltransferase YjiC (YdhE family)
LTAEKLAAAIGEMVTDARMRQRAGELGALLQAEDGIGSAVQIVNNLLRYGIN